MMHLKEIAVFSLLTTTPLILPAPKPHETSKPVQIFRPLLGRWEGGFVDPPVEGPVHLVEWEVILGGMAVRRTKKVSGDPLQVSLYFTDPQGQGVRFLTLSSLGYVSRGGVYQVDDRIVVEGTKQGPLSSNSVRVTFQVTPDGKLQDRFFGLENETWTQRHLIEYRKVAQAPVDPEEEVLPLFLN